MGKAIQLVANGDLKKWCGHNPPDEQRHHLSFDLFDSQISSENRAGIPALEGPHASRPRAGVIRETTSTSHRLF